MLQYIVPAARHGTNFEDSNLVLQSHRPGKNTPDVQGGGGGFRAKSNSRW